MPTSSRDSSEKRSRSGPIAALVVVGLLVLYPLSAGPAYWLHQKGWLSEKAGMVYVPLVLVFDKVPAAESLFDEYLDLWAR